MDYPDEDAKAAFERADALFRGGRHAEALVILSRLDARFPHTKNILYPLAQCLELTGDLDRAEAVCDELITQFKDSRMLGMKSRLIQRPRAVCVSGTPGGTVLPDPALVSQEAPDSAERSNRIMGDAAIALANMVPLAGALFFGWTTYVIIVVYASELVVLWFLSVLRMALAHGGTGAGIVTRLREIIPFSIALLIALAIFSLPFSIALALLPRHGLDGSEYAPHPHEIRLVDTMVGSLVENGEVKWVVLGAGALLLGNAASFFLTFVQSGRYRRMTFDEAVRRSDMRLPLVYMAATPAALVFSRTLLPVYAAVFLVVVKMVAELGITLWARQRFGY